MTETGDAERARLAEQIRNLSIAFETGALPTLLTPLLSVELTIQQLKVLTMLVTTDEGMTGSGLAEAFGVSMASMSGMLDRLVAQGMVERTSDPHDARVRRIHATEHGRSAMRRLVAARPEFENDVLLRIPLDDLRALARGMAAVGEELSRLHRTDR
ncbi:MarR family winged helix-turn-helix transcriptional regulator [Promicromonospora iranensis]|uniref:DNA-binding MarR family transcriptional regulator n=1 Tax=Promicromonospora iranensis TaxID=1105144 RepID=A0ABU2CLU2_9MICO|nr:MarR family transcriptional regulator [Promicromonospora iranensis]MDR7382286.1 DNA-binding MarR family transcriptional regulator [Promicromonospora iranensis]